MSETAEKYGNPSEKSEGKQMTAVEYLETICHDFIHPMHGAEFWQHISKAKEMEKEQIMDAQMDMFHHINDFPLGMEYLDKRNSAEKYAEKYHNQPYGE